MGLTTVTAIPNTDVWQGLKYVSGLMLPAQKMKFSIKDFFSKCDQIDSLQQIWSHLLKKSLMENFIFLCIVVKLVLH